MPARTVPAVLLLIAAALMVATVELGFAVGLAWHHAPAGQGDGSEWPQFLVVGDWGRDRQYNQTAVADAMDATARSMRVDFVVSTGDNFYEVCGG